MRIETLVAAAKKIGGLLNEAEITYYIVGSVAVHLHGAERDSGNYGDIDIFMRHKDKESVSDMVTGIGFKEKRNHYCLDGVKIGFCCAKKKRYSWLPDPGCPDSWIEIDCVRVLRIEDLIKMKAEVCKEFLDKVLSEGLGGPKRRTHLKKHNLDFIKLVNVYLEATRRSDCDAANKGMQADG